MRKNETRPHFHFGLALLVAVAAAPSADGAGRVQLELVGEGRGSSLVFQEWARVLGRAGIENVRIRSGRAGDKVGIEVRGSEKNPVYVVTGIVKSRDELRLPAGRFRRRDVGRLAAWLDDLAKHGPEDRREGTAAFGLTAKQFEEVRRAMARPVGFSTKGTVRSEAVAKIGRRLTLPLKIEPGPAGMLGRDKVVEELSGLSCGTALACVLRPAGFCLAPRESGGRLVCVVTRSRPGLEIWPVGWEPERPQRDVLPAMLKFEVVNVQGVSAAKAAEAIARRLKVPLLYDHNALARHGIDPAKVTVSHPSKRTTYGLALEKLLFQARLKSEVRVDESGKPFVWVTTVKPV